MKRFLLVVVTLMLLPQLTGCNPASTNPGGNITVGSSEAEEYEKRRAEEREKGIRPKVPTPTPAH